jgi:hypothetical protein
MNLKETIYEGVKLFDLLQNRAQWLAVMNAVITFWDQERMGNFLTSLTSVSFSRNTLLHAIKFV